MSFFAELKRRNVVRVGIAYVIAAWLLLQLTDVLIGLLGLPETAGKLVFLLLVIGFVPALIFAWAFEMTPDGLKREKLVDRSQSIAKKTGRKLDLAIIGALVIVAAYFIWESRFQEKPGMTTPGVTTADTVDQAITAKPVADRMQDKSIAVLPFANRSKAEDDAFFTDGIHDDLLTQLAKIGDLRVISRTSVMQYKNTQKTIPEIATELGVSTILEGGIQRAGSRIRINAQLIDVLTDEHLWAETFDREMTMENIFDIQSEIARQIVTAVKGELSEDEQQSLGAIPTKNLKAYEAYLHARAATNRSDYSEEKYIEAQPWAVRATELDPGFADAWALLAEIHAQAVWIGYDNSPERHAAAAAALDKALELNPGSVRVKVAQADHLYRFDNDYQAALQILNEARGLAPGDASVLFNVGLTQRRLGNWDESIQSFEQASLLDPANAFILTTMVETMAMMNEWQALDSIINELVIRHPDSMDLKATMVQTKIYFHGDLRLARELFDRLQPWPGNRYFDTANELLGLQRDFDTWLALQDSPVFLRVQQYRDDKWVIKGKIYYLMGDQAQSQRYLRQQIEQTIDREPVGTYADALLMSALALSWSYLDEHDKALQASTRAMEMLPQEKDHIFGTDCAHNHTLILARAGKRDEALARLAADIDKPQGFNRWQLYYDPAWDFFRDDERFNALATPDNLMESTQ